jgi:transcriptional regulator GlxA family with amidase domain
MVTTRRLRVGCCLYPGFDTLDVALFGAVLTGAGQRWNHRAFELSLLGQVPGVTRGVPSAMVADAPLASADVKDVLFVPGGPGADLASQDVAFIEALSRASRSAGKLCTSGRGQLLLAAADVLPGEAVCADEPLFGELERRLERPLAEASRELHVEGSCWVASKSLLVLKLALQLVRDTLGRGEADAMASALGQSPHDVLLRFKS